MLGPRQAAIIDALARGGCSYEALLHQVDAGRGQVLKSLRRLEDLGLVKMSGRRGKDLTAAWVELPKAVVTALQANSTVRRPLGRPETG